MNVFRPKLSWLLSVILVINQVFLLVQFLLILDDSDIGVDFDQMVQLSSEPNCAWFIDTSFFLAGLCFDLFLCLSFCLSFCLRCVSIKHSFNKPASVPRLWKLEQSLQRPSLSCIHLLNSVKSCTMTMISVPVLRQVTWSFILTLSHLLSCFSYLSDLR